MVLNLPSRRGLSFVMLALIIAALTAAITFLMSVRYPETLNEHFWHLFFTTEFILSVSLSALTGWCCYVWTREKMIAQLDDIMNSLISGVIHFERGGAIVKYNPIAAEMIPEIALSSKHEDRIGSYKKFLAYIYERSLEIKDDVRLQMEQGSAVHSSRFIFREVIRGDGKKILIIQFYQGADNEIMAIITDISLMKRHLDAMTALTDENRIILRAIEAGDNGFLIADMISIEPRINYVNKSFFKILDIPDEVLTDVPFYDFIKENFGEDAVALCEEAIKFSRKENKGENIWLKRKDGKGNITWYTMHVLSYLDSGDKEFVVCFMSDQTQARLKEAQIYQSQKLEAIARLSGGVAHDFNNVLSVVDGYTTLAERSLSRGKDIAPHFEEIRKAVRRGSEITGRLLTFGQLRVTEKMRMDICAHVRDLEPILSSMGDSSISLIVSVQQEPCYVDTSPDSVTQIILALLANAKEAMPDGGDIVVSVAEATKSQLLNFDGKIDPRQNYLCLQVFDSGSGIDTEIMGRIYEPFFTTKDPGKNPGLGLSIVYGLLKEMDALINVKSSPGIGTSFLVILPVKDAPLRGDDGNNETEKATENNEAN